MHRSMQRTSTVCAAIRAVEDYDASFVLDTVGEEQLVQFLSSETFCQQVVQDCKLPPGTRVEFTGMLFQPVPWSPNTKKGMPAAFEKYHADPAYSIINVPPNYMFKAKIFKPSRLCAVFKQTV